MDYADWDKVTARTWEQQLPYILRDISECTFVALDFEFSGIPPHQSQASGRQTLQERYVETKNAAQIYQILQVGLTIVKEDAVAGTYTLKPYSIHLSPLIDPFLGIDRTFSFSSAAVQFLRKAGFDLQAPFQDGVRYLSTKEERQAIEEVQKHNNRSRTASELPKEGSDSVAFLETVRRDINIWLTKKLDYLNIPSRDAVSTDGRPAVTSLNSFQKRLVHQLVETEYPSLVSIGGHRDRDFVRIIIRDEEREEKIRQERITRLENRLLEHRGVRWVIQALTGEDLSQLPHKVFKGMVEDSKKTATEHKTMDDFATDIKTKLQSKERQPPLVGHNIFMDLVYLWQCFYGDLPDRIEEFEKLLHEKFPMVIDTEYIFTHDCGDMNPIASLDVIAKTYKNITKPEIIIDPKHTRYQGREQPHEAGYDSLLTAKNFIKQAIKLPDARLKSSRLPSKVEQLQHIESHTSTQGVTVSRTTTTIHISTTNPEPRFAHKNMFDTLPADDTADDTDMITESNALAVANPNPELIPSFSSPTWKVYGNKLRVFGTHERVCKLDNEV